MYVFRLGISAHLIRQNIVKRFCAPAHNVPTSLAPEKGGFSCVILPLYPILMTTPAPMVIFSAQAVLALPHLVTECDGALIKGNRDERGRPQILCSFYPGELVLPTPSGLDVASAIVLSPADARALARELERAAEDAEEQ